ncbi:MAG: sulfotransferase [Phycisphaeraceae bacterium]|nr:sulfotransferase [Phycisphaeraceae bacterium]MCW5763789.1 sulfotransferase [Phycisphaeraceae bacterium]
MTETATDRQPATAPTAPGQLPTFIHIGGQRCGTTWVHKCLAEHPQVFMADPKELHFFNRHFEEGQAWYRAKFTPSEHHKAWGEATPAYLNREEVPQRIKDMCPQARLIACLRNPVDRAFSAYNLKRNGRLAYDTFEEALEKEPDIMERGHYADQLRRYYDLFPREQILVQLYDDLVHHEKRFIREIYAHIGVDADFKPSWLGKTDNAVILPRAQDRLKSLGLGWAIRTVRDSPLGNSIRRWNRSQKKKKAGQYKDMKPETKRMLLDHFAKPNEELSRMLGVDLSHWNA